jgi:hypothetical protein
MWLASNPQIVKVLDQFEMGVADLAGRQKLPERYETSTPLPSAICSEIARPTSNRNDGWLQPESAEPRHAPPAEAIQVRESAFPIDPSPYNSFQNMEDVCPLRWIGSRIEEV